MVSLNFGAIRDTIYRFATKEIISENSGGKKETTLSKFLFELKNNPVLKTQYLIFKNLEEGCCKNERLADRYILQTINLLEHITFQNILEENKKTRVSLLKKDSIHVQGNDKNKDVLYENIHVLIEAKTKNAFPDIARSEMAHEQIVQHLIENYNNKMSADADNKGNNNLEETDCPSLFSWKFVTNIAVNNFNKRYSHLNENEKKLLEMLLSSEEKKVNYFNDIKEENYNIINNLLHTEHTDKTVIEFSKEFKSKIEKLDKISKENSEKLNECLISCCELNDTLKEYLKN